MNLPWVSRKTLEVAKTEAHDQAARALLAEARLVARMADSDKSTAILENELASVRADNKLLIDRILKLSGQPALFNPEPVLAVAAKPSTMQGPKTKHTIDDVHGAAREAIRSGKLNIMADK